MKKFLLAALLTIFSYSAFSQSFKVSEERIYRDSSLVCVLHIYNDPGAVLVINNDTVFFAGDPQYKIESYSVLSPAKTSYNIQLISSHHQTGSAALLAGNNITTDGYLFCASYTGNDGATYSAYYKMFP